MPFMMPGDLHVNSDLGTSRDQRSKKNKVYNYLKQNYPERHLGWVHSAVWTGPREVPLQEIQMGRRPGARNPEKVAGISAKIDDGVSMDPVVLVQTPERGPLKIADGYHRTLAYKHSKKKTALAYVGTVDANKGPWDSAMHAAKINKRHFDPDEPRGPHGRWVTLHRATKAVRSSIDKELTDQGVPQDHPIRGVLVETGGRSHVLVARNQDGKIIGGIAGSIEGRKGRDRSFHISNMRVMSEEKGTGVGKALIAAAAKEVSGPSGSLSVGGAVDSAKPFYARTGATFIPDSNFSTWDKGAVEAMQRGERPTPGRVISREQYDHEQRVEAARKYPEYAREQARTDSKWQAAIDEVSKAHFHPDEPRDRRGRWTLAGELIHDLENVSFRDSRRVGVRRRRASSRVITSDSPQIKFDERPKHDDVQAAEDYIDANIPRGHEQYARMILRLATKRGISQDPKTRGEQSRKYGIPANDMVDIENQVYAVLFPHLFGSKVVRDRRIDPSVGGADVPKVQSDTMVRQGAKKAFPYPKSDIRHGSSARLFKATKGPNKGKWVKVAPNGTHEVVKDRQAQKDLVTIKNHWAERARIEAQALPGSAAARAAEQRQESEVPELRRLSKEAKIKAAQKWAEENGFDPTDSYWWGVYWNDPSLIKSQKDENLFGQGGAQPVNRRLIESAIFDAQNYGYHQSKKVRGAKVGQYAIFKHPDFPEQGWMIVRPSGEVVGMSKTKKAAIADAQKLIARPERRKGISLGSILRSADLSQHDYRGRRPGPRRALSEDEGQVPAKSPRRARPVQKSSREIRKAHFDPNEPRGFHGRWIHGAGILGESRRDVRRRAGTVTRGSGAASSVFDHHAKGLTTEGSRLVPRPNRGNPYYYHGIVPDSKILPRHDALYQRNNGKTKITNSRLKELWEHAISGKGKGPTAKELQLIASSRSAKFIDGEDKIKTTDSYGNPKTFARYELLGQLAGKWTPGSGNRAARPAMEQLPSHRQEKIRTKRIENEKVSKPEMDRYRRQIAEDWGDGKSAPCIFCRKSVSVHDMSIEKARPGKLGGTYGDRANRWPAHTPCNTRAQKEVQADPQTYMEDMMRRFQRLPLSTRKRLGFVHQRFRKYLGTTPK